MKILVAIDFSEITDSILYQASKLAQAMSAQTILVHVAEPNPDHITYDMDPASGYAINPAEVRDSIAKRFQNEHKTLQEHAESLRQQGLDCKALMIQGNTVEVLLTEAQKLQADFIIAGSHGKGPISQILLGGASEELVRKSKIPVYLVPAGD